MEERRAKARALRQERRRKPDKPDDFVTYEDSGSDEEEQQEVLNTSFNLCDYLRSRENDLREVNAALFNEYLIWFIVFYFCLLATYCKF